MEDKPNLDHMWAAPLRGLDNANVEIDSMNLEYLRLITIRIPGVCGEPFFDPEYIINKHPSLTIDARILTRVEYKGVIIRSEKSPVLSVKPGDGNKIELGCTGWLNPTGANHTFYWRMIIGPND